MRTVLKVFFYFLGGVGVEECAFVFMFNGFVRLFYYSVLGKRLGKSMGVVAKEVKAMSQESILGFEKAGEVTLSGHCLKLADIKVLIFHC